MPVGNSFPRRLVFVWKEASCSLSRFPLLAISIPPARYLDSSNVVLKDYSVTTVGDFLLSVSWWAGTFAVPGKGRFLCSFSSESVFLRVSPSVLL